MCKNLGYHYRDSMHHKHQCHKGKDSGEVGLERKQNRKCAQRLKDTMREEKEHTQRKRQKARKENEWDQGDKNREKETKNK